MSSVECDKCKYTEISIENKNKKCPWCKKGTLKEISLEKALFDI